MRKNWIKRGLLLLPAICLLPAPAKAAFVVVDNFEGLTPGTLNGQNGWVSQDASSVPSGITVATDPANSLNSVLNIPSAFSVSAYHAIGPITNASTSATLFARFRYESGTLNVSWGTSDITTPIPSGNNTFTDFETQLVNTGTTLSVRSGGPPAQPAETITVSTWYNTWMVINNSSDTYEVYLQQDGLETNPVIHLDNNNSPFNNVFGFRNGTAANDLVNFLLRTDGNTSIFYLDDIYLDTTTVGANLSDPTAVPEPAGLTALIAASATCFIRRRQRQH